MEKLQAQVKAMLEGEKKRREKAENFLNVLEEILIDVAPDIWGNGQSVDIDEATQAVWVWRLNEEGKVKNTSVYFRYGAHAGQDEEEKVGFYLSTSGPYADIPVWGENVKYLRGKDFWYAIQVILEWIPFVTNNMEKRSIGRDKLLALINI